MKKLSYLLMAVAIFCLSCNEDETVSVEEGTFLLKFENFAGETEIDLTADGSKEYTYTTESGEAFNLTTFRYYVSRIRLEGPDGELFEDVMNVSPDADDVKGFYLVNEADASSKFITLKGVPAGSYNKVSFTIGIGEEGIEEGAAGGILDPAEGAWFWNWNAGYIGFAMEGNAANSGQEQIDGDGWSIEEGSFSFHIGGWKDVTPAEGETQKFVNNLKEITLSFDSNLTVGQGLDPNAHIIVDAAKILDGAAIRFETTYAIHAPAKGKTLAEQLPGAFILDHVHQ
ncbi:MAG: MbnP family protein [Cyclobacteriaceae bacterium]